MTIDHSLRAIARTTHRTLDDVREHRAEAEHAALDDVRRKA